MQIHCDQGQHAQEITDLKQYLLQHFQAKDLGSLQYFLGIEMSRSKKGIFLSQRKYVLDILFEAGLSECRDVTPMKTNAKLLPDRGTWIIVIVIED